MLFIAVGLIAGTYEVLDMDPIDCGGIRIVLWASVILHTCNIIVTLMNLCGLETKVCNCNMVFGYGIFQMAIFLFMQFTYFESQANKCMYAAPTIYWWLMAQILLIWVGFAIIVCHFFRKYCQVEPDPQDVSPGDIEEDFLGYNPSEVHDFSTQYANI